MEDKVNEGFEKYWPTLTVEPSTTWTILSCCARSYWNECFALCWSYTHAVPQCECWRYILWIAWIANIAPDFHQTFFPSLYMVHDVGLIEIDTLEWMSWSRAHLERECRLPKNVKNGLRRSMLEILLLLKQQLTIRTNGLVKILNDHSIRKKCRIWSEDAYVVTQSMTVAMD